MTAQAKLPAANEFSPGQLGGSRALIELLDGVQRLSGDRGRVVEWIRHRWFADAAPRRADDPVSRLEQQRKRAQNVLSGMRQYGLLTDSTDPFELTDLGKNLLSKRDCQAETMEFFATFLLRERHGLALLEAANSVLARKGSVSAADLADELRARGFKLPTHSSYPAKLREWLEPSGVVDHRWIVDQKLLVRFAGVGSSDVTVWRGLTPEQRAVVEILRVRALGNNTPIQSHDLLGLLRQRGVAFNDGQVAKQIYEPLVGAGLITRNVKAGGRGSKGGLVALTDYGAGLDTTLIENLELGNVPPELQAQMSRTTDSIISDLRSSDTGVKGVALELLSLRMAADIGLLPADMRLRSADTGGAEVDLVAEGAHLHFSRWLFQCKNQRNSVGLSVLAKEIGMATLLKAQVVAIVTTGSFAKSVLDYARQAAEATAIQIILLDGRSLASYKAKGPRALQEILHRMAESALKAKRPQLSEVPRQ